MELKEGESKLYLLGLATNHYSAYPGWYCKKKLYINLCISEVVENVDIVTNRTYFGRIDIMKRHASCM